MELNKQKSQKVKESTKRSTLQKRLCKKIRDSFILVYLVCLKMTLKSYIPNGRRACKMNSIFIANKFVARVYPNTAAHQLKCPKIIGVQN